MSAFRSTFDAFTSGLRHSFSSITPSYLASSRKGEEGSAVSPCRAARLAAFLVLPMTIGNPGHAEPGRLSFLYPENGQIVGGPDLLLAAQSSRYDLGGRVIFELSEDGQNFTPLTQQDAPDFGVGFHTSSVDISALPVGTAYFRTRYHSDATGPVIAVQIRRPPQPACQASLPSSGSSTVTLDCSASTDSNGGILSYSFDFGDGSAETQSPFPTIDHAYRGPGTYPVSVTVTDSVGLTATLLQQLVLANTAMLADRPDCSCDKMTVSANPKAMSTLGDFRRRKKEEEGGFDPAPLGPDEMFRTFNFEIAATTAADSDPSKCMEGQNVKWTSKIDFGNATLVKSKKACSKGAQPLLSECDINVDCSTRTCKGGTNKGKDCTTDEGRKACTDGKGRCVSNNDGVCTAYPIDGGDLGLDGFRAPEPDAGGRKHHIKKDVVWFHSFDGNPTATSSFTAEAEYLAFLNGSRGNAKSCSCHFTMSVSWDRKTEKFGKDSGLTLAKDSVACEIKN
jgi:hypothetical protein